MLWIRMILLSFLAMASLTVKAGEIVREPLPYDYSALEPYIDSKTMQIHYERHYQAYINMFNSARAKLPANLADMPVDVLLRNLNLVPAELQTAVRNGGGGYWNHHLFWGCMQPEGGSSTFDALASDGFKPAVLSTFITLQNLTDVMTASATRVFGSGWAWLVWDDSAKSLKIEARPNQDSPAMDHGTVPLLGIDVWEHAYYLKYQNYRADYVSAWWNVVNWTAVAARFQDSACAMKSAKST